jgi:hypothetical protein
MTLQRFEELPCTDIPEANGRIIAPARQYIAAGMKADRPDPALMTAQREKTVLCVQIPHTHGPICAARSEKILMRVESYRPDPVAMSGEFLQEFAGPAIP